MFRTKISVVQENSMNTRKHSPANYPEQWRGRFTDFRRAAKRQNVSGWYGGITKAFADGVAALASVNDGLDRLLVVIWKATKETERV